MNETEGQNLEQTMSAESAIEMFLRINNKYSDETFYNILSQRGLTETQLFKALERSVFSEKEPVNQENENKFFQENETNNFEDEMVQ